MLSFHGFLRVLMCYKNKNHSKWFYFDDAISMVKWVILCHVKSTAISTLHKRLCCTGNWFIVYFKANLWLTFRKWDLVIQWLTRFIETSFHTKVVEIENSKHSRASHKCYVQCKKLFCCNFNFEQLLPFHKIISEFITVLRTLFIKWPNEIFPHINSR